MILVGESRYLGLIIFSRIQSIKTCSETFQISSSHCFSGSSSFRVEIAACRHRVRRLRILTWNARVPVAKKKFMSNSSGSCVPVNSSSELRHLCRLSCLFHSVCTRADRVADDFGRAGTTSNSSLPSASASGATSVATENSGFAPERITVWEQVTYEPRLSKRPDGAPKVAPGMQKVMKHPLMGDTSDVHASTTCTAIPYYTHTRTYYGSFDRKRGAYRTGFHYGRGPSSFAAHMLHTRNAAQATSYRFAKPLTVYVSVNYSSRIIMYLSSPFHLSYLSVSLSVYQSISAHISLAL